MSLQAEFTAPKPDHVLQISVQSATRTGNQIVLVLTGTYGGNSSTLWDHTTVVANSDTGTCGAKATPGFPPGTHPRSSVVNGTWTLNCPGSGSIRLVIDPYGGLLANSSFLLVLR